MNNDFHSQNDIDNQGQQQARSFSKPIVIGGSVLLVIIVALGALIFMQNQKLDEAVLRTQELELENQQLELSNQYEELSSSFQQHEGQMMLFNNDSIRAEYEAAKNRVEELTAELKRRDRLSSQRIAELQKEIDTLREIMKHYVEQIKELNQENEALRSENKTLANQNNRLTSQVESQTAVNRELSQRMELAEKLNVTMAKNSATSPKPNSSWSHLPLPRTIPLL